MNDKDNEPVPSGAIDLDKLSTAKRWDFIMAQQSERLNRNSFFGAISKHPVISSDILMPKLMEAVEKSKIGKKDSEPFLKTIDYLTTYSDGEAPMCDEALFEQLKLIVNKRRMDINIVTPSTKGSTFTVERMEKMIHDCLGPGFVPTPPVWPNSAMFYNVDFHSAKIPTLSKLGSSGGADIVIDSMSLFDLPGSKLNYLPEVGDQENCHSLKKRVFTVNRYNKYFDLEKETKELSWWQIRDKHRQEKKAKQTAYKEKFFSKRSQKKEVKINPLLAKLVKKEIA